MKVIETFDDIFKDYDYIVAPSASCAAYVRVYYPKILEGKHDCVASKKIMDIVEFLHDVLKVDHVPGKFAHVVSVHNSCHGVRELGLSSPSEQHVAPFNKIIDLLQMVEGITIHEPERKDECCGFGGMFSDMYGVGAVIGMSDAENEARIKQLGEAMPDSQRILNKLLQDRLGMKDHKGLYAWCHSHIPTVRNAIATGEPFKPRVWFDMSGNKLAMLGNAKSWYDVFPEVDYIIGQYPMLTSFHIEACDLVFPLREWLEEPMVNMTQLDTQWLQNECVHIGETVSHSIPAAQVVAKCREMWGGHIPNGLELGDGTAYLGSATEAEVKQGVADTLGAPDWETLQANTDEYVPFVTPDYWNYNQHEQIADDGLPSGFATESRKVETYCQMLIRMARNGYPYCYPEPQEACEDYSPICVPIEPVESPYEGMAGYDPEYPFVLTSGRVPYFHHGTMRHAPFSRELFPCAEIRINPASAKELGIEHMDWVKVTSRRGEVHARAYLTEGVNPKTVWMERFWNPECYDASQANPTGGWRECNVNVLTKNDAPFNEVYGSYTNRGFTVKIEKSERPANIWVEAEEFEPFMPTQEMLAEAQTKDVF